MQPRLGAAMAVTCGIAVATIYFIQPLLGAVERAFSGSGWAALIPTLTQLGYAAGLIALVPLGDTVDRRKLVLGQLACLASAGLRSVDLDAAEDHQAERVEDEQASKRGSVMTKLRLACCSGVNTMSRAAVLARACSARLAPISTEELRSVA